MKQKISRRQFLKLTGATAGALAFPTIVPSTVFGANAPSNRITVGCIGRGKQAIGLMRSSMGIPNVQFISVCDVDKGRVKAGIQEVNRTYAAKMGTGEYKGCTGHEDFREMLANPELDAVIIATPDHWHGLIGVAACKAGKDVYLEKPIALTHHEGRAIADAAKKYGTVFQVGSMQRSNRSFRFSSELVRNGLIGKVKEVWISIGGPSSPFCDLPAQPVPPTLNWDFWLGPAPWRPYHSDLAPDGANYRNYPNWRGYDEFASGAQADIGAHHYDIAQWGLGTDHTGPVEVVPPNGKEVETLTYTYADGVKMYVGSKLRSSAVQWIGEKGWVAVNRGDFLQTEPASLADLQLGPDSIRLYKSNNHMQNWIDCIRTRKPTICTAEIGHRTATICQIGMIAFRLGRPLKWDPNTERFVGDDVANRMLSRPMRSPWVLEI